MTADEVVDEIKNLRPEEQARVLDLLLELTAAQDVPSSDESRFDRVADAVLTRHADLMRKLAQ